MGFFKNLFSALTDDDGEQDNSLYKFYRNMGKDYLINTIINNKDTTLDMKTVAIMTLVCKDRTLSVELYEKHKEYAKPIIERWSNQRKMYTLPTYNLFVSEIKKWEKANGGLDLHVF